MMSKRKERRWQLPCLHALALAQQGPGASVTDLSASRAANKPAENPQRHIASLDEAGKNLG